MRILILTAYLPHPLSGHGGGEYVHGLVKHLSKSNEVSVLSFADEQELELSKDLKNLPVRCHVIPRRKGSQKDPLRNFSLLAVRMLQLARSILLWQPYYISKYRNRKMARLIAQETMSTTYDIIQTEFAQMGQYVRFARSGKKVIREHDVMFRPAYRQYRKAPLTTKLIYLAEWCRWAMYERKMVKRFDCVLTFTEQDKNLLSRLTGVQNVRYSPRGIEIPDVVSDYSSREPFSVLFVGTFNHVPNVDAAFWLCSEIFPELQKLCSQSTLYIIGKNAPFQIRALASDNPRIKLLGFVPRIEEYLNRVSVFIAPIRLGGGIKTKNLHAQSYGIPVVTTPVGAEGIEKECVEAMVVKRECKEIVNGIVTLFNDAERAGELSRRGRQAVVRHYAWSSVVKDLERMYSGLLHGSTRHAS